MKPVAFTLLFFLVFKSAYAATNQKKTTSSSKICLAKSASKDEIQSHLSNFSKQYIQAEMNGDLKKAYKIITKKTLPFIKCKHSAHLRTEVLLRNMTNIKQSLEKRIHESKKNILKKK